MYYGASDEGLKLKKSTNDNEKNLEACFHWEFHKCGRGLIFKNANWRNYRGFIWFGGFSPLIFDLSTSLFGDEKSSNKTDSLVARTLFFAVFS